MIRASRSPASLAGVTHTPIISVRQAAQRVALIRVVQALAGTGTVGRATRRQREGEAATVGWNALGGDAIALAARLAPHLVLKRGQAEAVARFPYRGRTPVPVSNAQFALRGSLYETVRGLNDRFRDLPWMREQPEVE
jgi:hypothetical protein